MTLEDLQRIDRECVWWTYAKGTNWRYLGEKGLERARLVLVEGKKISDVARAQGISRQRIYQAINRAKFGAAKLNIS